LALMDRQYNHIWADKPILEQIGGVPVRRRQRGMGGGVRRVTP